MTSWRATIGRGAFFMAGLMLGVCMPAIASEFVVQCRAVAQRSCDNFLKMHFEGGIPNRCKVS